MTWVRAYLPESLHIRKFDWQVQRSDYSGESGGECRCMTHITKGQPLVMVMQVGRVCLGAIYGEILTHGLPLPYPVYFPFPIFHSKVMPPTI